VIFVDLSLAQMAALGGAVAVLAGVQPDSQAAFLYALGFTTIGAILFSLSRSEEKGRVPQEAIPGPFGEGDFHDNPRIYPPELFHILRRQPSPHRPRFVTGKLANGQ